MWILFKYKIIWTSLVMMDFDCKLFMILCIMVNQWAMTTAEFWQSSNYYGMDISTRGSQRRPAELRRHRHRHQHDDGLSMLSNGVEIEDISTGRSKLHEKNVSRKGQRQKNDKNGNLHFKSAFTISLHWLFLYSNHILFMKKLCALFSFCLFSFVVVWFC